MNSAGIQKAFMIRASREDKVFTVVTYTLATLALVVALYPLLYAVSASFSSPLSVVKGEVWLLPRGFTFDAFKKVIRNDNLWLGYYNTILYTAVGTLINLVMTVMGAYPLSKRDLCGRNGVVILLTMTMFFSGGLVPNFLLIRNLGLYNTFWVMVLPGAISVHNLLIMRNYFQNSVSAELCEAACIDGCSNAGTLIHIILPVSKSILAVMTVFYAVAHWNSYFNAMIYLNDRSRYPLQLVLREILLMGANTGFEQTGDVVVNTVDELLSFETLKFAVIIVASVPMLILYPSLQKYFAKGVMVGAIKG